MTKPTAPCLTADYHTYSTYAQREDYYGGLDLENSIGNGNNGPHRIGYQSKHINNQDSYVNKKFTQAHCISLIYSAIFCVIIAMNAFLYLNGVRHKFLLIPTIASLVAIAICGFFHVGLIRLQPFFCIPFVVLRTLDTFISGTLLVIFTCAIVERQSNFFMFFLQLTKELSRSILPYKKINHGDATIQLCIIGWSVSAAMLAISFHVCVLSFKCTMSIADNIRKSKKNNYVQAQFYAA